MGLRANLAVRGVVMLAALAVVLAGASALLFLIGALFGSMLGGFALAQFAGVETTFGELLSGTAPLSYTAVLVGGGVIGVGAGVWYSHRDAHDQQRAALEAAREPSDAERPLVEAVERLAAQFDVPAPAVRVLETADPTAYATRFEGEQYLVVSKGLLRVLDESAVTAVLAHELGHVANRDLRTTTLAMVPLLSSERVREFGRPNNFKKPIGALMLAVAFWLPGAVLEALSGMAIALFARGREFAADRAAAKATGDPAALARALERLDEATAQTPSADLRERTAVVNVMSVLPGESDGWLPQRIAFATHPSTEKRIERLREIERQQETG